MDTAKELSCTNILKDGELRWVTRNINNLLNFRIDNDKTN
jgi:hypothetical protein